MLAGRCITMKLSRELVKERIKMLYDTQDYECDMLDLNTASDDKLIEEYFLSGLFADYHTDLYEQDVEGLE